MKTKPIFLFLVTAFMAGCQATLNKSGVNVSGVTKDVVIPNGGKPYYSALGEQCWSFEAGKKVCNSGGSVRELKGLVK